MDASLIYCVAQEYIIVRTPSKEATRSLLPNYEPFLVEEIVRVQERGSGDSKMLCQCSR